MVFGLIGGGAHYLTREFRSCFTDKDRDAGMAKLPIVYADSKLER